MNCTHTHTTEGEHYGFTAPLYPCDAPNPAAHGGVAYTETCTDCGATREVLANFGDYEYGPWNDED
jgi:hypothetical protein